MDRHVGWATPTPVSAGLAFLANALKHRVRGHDCIARRQGQCPGLEYCHDCPWTEGVGRDGTDR